MFNNTSKPPKQYCLRKNYFRLTEQNLCHVKRRSTFPSSIKPHGYATQP
ncbi:MAG: hypothetical protein RLZZ543_957, partial [Bacteroidota bacterium]